MARRNIYLVDELDERVRLALQDPGTRFSVSDVCAAAIGAALNGQAPEVEHQAVPAAPAAALGELEQLARQLGDQAEQAAQEQVRAAALAAGHLASVGQLLRVAVIFLALASGVVVLCSAREFSAA